jgi:integrase
VAHNVAEAATPAPVGSVRHGRPEAWTSDQLRRFLDFVADSRYLPAWVFLATTGCRQGECPGLQWRDLDLEAGTAVSSRQVTAVDHELRIKELPKTKRGHMIRLDSGTVGMLRRWRARQAEEKLLVGAGYFAPILSCRRGDSNTARWDSSQSTLQRTWPNLQHSRPTIMADVGDAVVYAPGASPPSPLLGLTPRAPSARAGP